MKRKTAKPRKRPGISKPTIDEFAVLVMATHDEMRDVILAHEWTWKILLDQDLSDCEADISVDTVYLGYTIRVSKQLRAQYEKEKCQGTVRSVVVHEMCHLLTAELFSYAYDGTAPAARVHLDGIHERQTQRIANALVRQLYAGDFTDTEARI